MKSKIINKDNYKIHLYKTDKFKSVEIHVLLRNTAKLDNYLMKAYVELLYLTTKNYKTKIDRYIKQEELYNTSLNISCRRYGHENILDYAIEYLNPKEVKDDYTEDVIDFLFDIINNPLFDESKLKEIKDKLIYSYKQKLERPATLADMNAEDLYFENDLDKVQFIVDEDTVNSITMDQIKNKYNEIINNSAIDIYVLGNIDDSIVDIIDKKNNLKSIDIDFEYFIDNPTTDKVKEKTEIKKDIKQAQIVMLYNAPKFDYRLFRVIVLYITILGNNSLSSRLFKTVREDNQLCYNIQSYYDATDSYVGICTSVDNKNVEKTLKLINEVYDSMVEITDEELEKAKAKILKQYVSIEDSLFNIYFRLIFEEILGRQSVEEEIEIVKSVTKEEIMEVNNMLKLNTVYVLKGE